MDEEKIQRSFEVYKGLDKEKVKDKELKIDLKKFGRRKIYLKGRYKCIANRYNGEIYFRGELI